MRVALSLLVFLSTAGISGMEGYTYIKLFDHEKDSPSVVMATLSQKREQNSGSWVFCVWYVSLFWVPSFAEYLV